MTISSSNGYKSAVFAPIRETRARVTINMSAFSQVPSQVFNETVTYAGKITASTVENPHIAKANNSTSLIVPSSFTTEFSQVGYDAIKAINASNATSSTVANGGMAQHLFGIDMVTYLERKFGMWIWNKRNPTLSEKVAIARTIITQYIATWRGWGTSPTGSSAKLHVWNGSAWTQVGSHTLGSSNPISTTQTNMAIRIGTDGFAYFLAQAEASNGTVISQMLSDYFEIAITVTQTTNRTFEDSRIIGLDIVEEVDILNITSPANQLTIKLDNTDNLFSFISLSNLQTIVASRPKFSMEIGVVLADKVTVEWIPMGVFYMDNWQQDTGGMTVTFTCHDLLYILANSSFPITPIANLGTALQSLLASVSITDYAYDPIIDTINGGNRPTRYTNCRTLLQNLAIGTGLTLYQDRLGTLKIVKFNPIAQATSYTTFTTSQAVGTGRASLFGGYPSTATVGGMPKSVSKQDTDGGMRAITIDQQYEIPQVTLEPSVYQINVNVYKNNPSDPSFDILTYTNPNLSGNAGDSFTIDNMLITDTTNAQAVATRFFNELNFNLIYVARWRQNPVLESTDVIMINDTETSAKQARVTKQEFSYQGFLTGTTESRGGI